jgi:hypothetical protein
VSKKPKFSGSPPSADRQPKIAPVSGTTGSPVWKMARIDFGGPWCPTVMTQDILVEIVNKLKTLERSTWMEIERGGSHFIPINGIIKEARQRLEQLKIDDAEALFSLRVSGKERIWGLRSNDVFTFLWWDPDHKVCPSNKSHT